MDKKFCASSVDPSHPLSSVQVSTEPVQLILTDYCYVPQHRFQQEQILNELVKLESKRLGSINMLGSINRPSKTG